jgi:hypothetical protein
LFLYAGDVDLRSLWSLDRMQAYIALIKTLHPRMSDGAGRVLQAYYRYNFFFVVVVVVVVALVVESGSHVGLHCPHQDAPSSHV